MSEPVEGGPSSAEEGRAKPPYQPPYQPPAIAWEESWRSRADLMAACGKADVGTFDCDTNGIAS